MDRNQRDLLVIDLEASCWETDDPARPSKPGNWTYLNEIIEIGAVLVDGESLAIKDQFQSLVRPRFHPVLSDFCQALTGIASAEVDTARDLSIVLEEFTARFNLKGDERDPVFASWGAYDKKQLDDDCAKYGLTSPFAPNNHLNLKPPVSRVAGRKRAGLKTMLEHLGLRFEGNHHRGLDDARNIVRILDTLHRRQGHNRWLWEAVVRASPRVG